MVGSEAYPMVHLVNVILASIHPVVCM